MNTHKPKIAMLVSGGVDSAVSLALLKDQGADVTAFYLKIWLEDELAFLGNCPWEDDLNYAQQVCSQLGVELKVVSLQREYWDNVVAYTIAQAKAGRTPNPDILCNQMIKFGCFYDKAGQGFDYIATGHYAQVKMENGKAVLMRSPDPIKDQTYFLSHLSQEQLQKAMFPIGHLLKSQVKHIAATKGLAPAERKESFGICFLGKISFNEFLRHHLGDKPGNFVEFETGKIMGQHKGYWYHTIGQRKGIGLHGGPWYVLSKDIEKNIVYISCQYHDENKKRDTFSVADCHWISGTAPEMANLLVKLRHGPALAQCTLNLSSETDGIVHLTENDQGIAPGQFAVFYDDQICLGSGVMGL